MSCWVGALAPASSPVAVGQSPSDPGSMVGDRRVARNGLLSSILLVGGDFRHEPEGEVGLAPGEVDDRLSGGSEPGAACWRKRGPPGGEARLGERPGPRSNRWEAIGFSVAVGLWSVGGVVVGRWEWVLHGVMCCGILGWSGVRRGLTGFRWSGGAGGRGGRWPRGPGEGIRPGCR